jgi:cytochrome P450
MTLHPEVQARAQAEIDSVLGPENLPTIADRSRLPFVEAILWEVLRWGQVGPQGLPHVSQQDDVHRGYLIPKGTIVIANIWQVICAFLIQHSMISHASLLGNLLTTRKHIKTQ